MSLLSRNKNVIGVLLILIFSSFLVSLYSYKIGFQIFNAYDALASFLFWMPILAIILILPLRYVAKLFSSYIRTARGVAVFASYLTVHLFLYGLILEAILTFAYKIPPITNQAAVSVTSILLSPESFITTLGDFAINPSLNIVIPPGYGLSLSLYSFVVAVLVAVLVVANVLKVVELSSVCSILQKSRAFVALPAIGVIGGAACCLSLPVLLSILAPVTAVLSGSDAAYYVAYLAFPAATVIALKYNLDSTLRIASRMSVPIKAESTS